MSNFFNGYGIKAYQKKHSGEEIDIIQTTGNEGTKVPNPTELEFNKKLTREEKKRLYPSED